MPVSDNQSSTLSLDQDLSLRIQAVPSSNPGKTVLLDRKLRDLLLAALKDLIPSETSNLRHDGTRSFNYEVDGVQGTYSISNNDINVSQNIRDIPVFEAAKIKIHYDEILVKNIGTVSKSSESDLLAVFELKFSYGALNKNSNVDADPTPYLSGLIRFTVDRATAQQKLPEKEYYICSQWGNKPIVIVPSLGSIRQVGLICIPNTYMPAPN